MEVLYYYYLLLFHRCFVFLYVGYAENLENDIRKEKEMMAEEHVRNSNSNKICQECI